MKYKTQWLKRIIFIMLFFTIFSQIYVYATSDTTSSAGIIDPDKFEPSDIEGADVVINKGAVIVDVIRTIGIIVTVVSLIAMGIKYMTGSIEEKAEYKKSMLPYLIGVLIFFALSQLITAVIDIVTSIKV